MGRRGSRARRAIEQLASNGRGGIRIVEAATGGGALAFLELVNPSLVVASDELPDLGVVRFVCRLRRLPRARSAPLLIAAAKRKAGLSRHEEQRVLRAGADEYLPPPLPSSLLAARVESYLCRRPPRSGADEIENLLFLLAQTIEHRDAYTSGHCQRLAELAVRLGRRLGLSAEENQALYRGGYLHDIGKIAVPDAVLFKAGPLSAEEWALMRSHTTKGEEICRPVAALSRVLPIIRHHHERWDGSGYPDQLRGEEIPLLARVLQVADIYDALTTDRPYKPALSPQTALDTLRHEARLGWRDPDLVRLFSDLAPAMAPGPLRATA